MSFKKWLHNHIKESTFTRAGLATAIGVSKPAVDKWLAGNGYPKVHSLYYICSVLFPSTRDQEYIKASALIVQDLSCGS